MPEGLHPLINLPERSRIDGIQATRPLCPHPSETTFAQHAQMKGDRRLGDTKLTLNDSADRSRGLFAVRKQLQDPPTDRVAENIEGVHDRIV